MTKTSFEYQNNKSRSSNLYNTTSFYPLAALALAACGGGGGGGSSPTPQEPDPDPDPNGGGGGGNGNGGDDPVATAPVLTPSGSQTLTLNEGTIATETATGYSFTTTDQNGDNVVLTLTGDSENRFAIDDTDGTLNIVAGSVFDFEAEETITLTITATDDSPSLLTDTAEVTITVTDVAAEAPILTRSGEQVTLNEGTVTSETATGYSFTAADDDGDNVILTLTGDSENRFAIADDGTLNIVAGSIFDFETEPTITLTITATDDSTGALTDTQEVTITVTDVTGDPVISVTGTQSTLNEGVFQVATATGHSFTATDVDGDTVTLSVNDERFTIADDGTLNIVAGSVFDFETEETITLTITATDSSENALTTTAEVTITVTDVTFDSADSAVLTTAILRISSAPAFGDVDGDGDIDLLVGRNDGNFDYYRWGAADGTGTGWTAVTLPDTHPLATSVGSGSRPGFGDYDGDGDIDLLVGEAGPTFELLNLFRRSVDTDGNTVWSDPTSASIVSDIRGSGLSSAFGDVDGDGDLDLVFGTTSGVLRFARWGDAVGTEGSTGWTAVNDAENPFHVINPASDNGEFDVGTVAAPAFFDVDGDGDMDLVVGSSDGDLHFFRRGTATDGADADSDKSWSNQTDTMDASGNRINPFYVDDPAADTEPFDVDDNARPVFGDVDNDGDLDLVVGEAFGSLNIWYWNDADDVWQTTSDL